MPTNPTLVVELERELDRLGYELVELDQAGSRSAGVGAGVIPASLRLRIDRPDTRPEPGLGVTIEECVEVARRLNHFLEERFGENAPALEVSSPGFDRPLTRRADWDRFVGLNIGVQGREALAPNGQKRFEGILLGVTGEAEAERVRLRLPEGSEVEFPLRSVERARLVKRWAPPGPPGKAAKGSSSRKSSGAPRAQSDAPKP